MPKLYYGERAADGTVVVFTKQGLTGRPIGLAHFVRHSPTGFNWGYGGSGPADLALSILIDVLGRGAKNSARADRLYQAFKWAYIATAGERFSISEDQVLAWVKENE